MNSLFGLITSMSCQRPFRKRTPKLPGEALDVGANGENGDPIGADRNDGLVSESTAEGGPFSFRFQ